MSGDHNAHQKPTSYLDNKMKAYIGRFKKSGDRKVDIRIDYWDTWNMDHTLTMIIAPMLKQLKATKHGAPLVDNEDVPEHLRSTGETSSEHHIDDNHFARWDWVLDEMIWTFEAILEGESKFYDHSEVDDNASLRVQLNQMKVDTEGLQANEERITNGLRLFGKYYRSLWD
jgi:hypothetical protein